ncbi:glycosyltransferase [Hymenobacter metallilatus]|uniref:Glycosyltransferase n=1 Tax=Hymenobacter metallilatus TaxID=2493666 RepID=A0A428JHN6_9BACT|nr:glycosyltransferase [Hymenobacter metallilatus]RSK32350.1 glycosyltransferase [Hymenobacter metallilatus]
MSHATPLRFHAATSAGSLVGSPWQLAPAPAPELRASVIIPAKDEAATIAATLAALAAQVDAHGHPLPPRSFEVLVLANNCQDATACLAREFGACHPGFALHVAETTLPAPEAHVGRARQLLMDEACRRLEQAGQPLGFIASTDADTQVAPTWLAATHAALAAGADAVGGRILMNETAPGCPVRRRQLQDATYQLLHTQLAELLDPLPHDPWPRHHQHFGASLALTAAAYRRVGGLPAVPYLEDEALYQALLHHDLRVRHCSSVRVYTSARRQGRVAVGLSWQLQEWGRLGEQEPMVPHPAGLVTELCLRQQLRALWQQAQAPETLPVALRHLAGAAADYPTFGAFWHWAKMQLNPGEYAVLPLSEAIRELRQVLAALRR